MREHLLGLSTAIIVAAASPAAATIVLNTGAGVLQPDENLLFTNNPAPGLIVQGITNQSDTLVDLTGGEILVGDGGQARLDSQDGTISSTFTFHGFTNQLVGFDLNSPASAFTSTEFRLFGGTATQATLTFVDTDGDVFTQTFAIPANGFFNALAINDELIDYFSIAANGTIGDIRQVRVGGIQIIGRGGGTSVPEPAAWSMMIMGFGAAGGLLRRRRTVAAA